jgi:hypothetical protein
MAEPSPSPPAAPSPAPAPLPASASENKRFESPPDPFAGIAFPDKFKRDGKPDLSAFVNSYGELETRFNTKTEELKRQIAEEQATNRPKAATEYQIPKIAGIDEKELAEHPMVAWWRDEAFSAGLPQDKFAKAVEKYIEAVQPQAIPEDTLKAELGDSFKQRIAAVDAWAQKTAKDDAEMDAFRSIGTSPAGIRLMERLAGLSGTMAADDPAHVQPAVTLEQLRAMQQDPRYWDSARRDPALVKQVEEGYQKLYPDAKRSA